MSDDRARIWTFIIYPEESVSNYMEIMRDSFVPTCLSPLHSPESMSGDELKKHVHVMVQFEGKKSLNQMEDFINALRVNGIACTRANPVISKVALIRYFVHDGWEDKEQLRYDQIICLNGFNYQNEQTVSFLDVMVFIQQLGLEEYADVMDACMNIHPDWVNPLAKGLNNALKNYLDSKRFKANKKY